MFYFLLFIYYYYLFITLGLIVGEEDTINNFAKTGLIESAMHSFMNILLYLAIIMETFYVVTCYIIREDCLLTLF